MLGAIHSYTRIDGVGVGEVQRNIGGPVVCFCRSSFLSHLWSGAARIHTVSATKDNHGRTAQQYMLELEKLDEHKVFMLLGFFKLQCVYCRAVLPRSLKDIVTLLQLGSRLFILL